MNAGSICTEGTASRALARMKACLKRGWAINSLGADEARAELAAGGAHAQIGGDRLAVADAAGDEHRHLAQLRQDLLRQHAGRDRADMAARLHALDDQRVGAAARTSFLATPRLGAKHSSLAPPSLTRAMVARGGRPPASTTWPTRVREADLDQLRRAAGA